MTDTALRPGTPDRALAAGLPALPKRIVRACRHWLRKRRSRRRLAELDDWLLRDIGLSEGEAMREVRKSFPWHRSFPWHDVPPDPWR